MNSNTNNDNTTISLQQIVCPNLQNDYANGFAEVFNNINANFGTLSNHDFVKGDAGGSIVIKSEVLSTGLKDKLRNAINTKNNTTIPNDSPIFNILNSEDAGKIQMIYNVDGITNTETPVASLYYVFLDGRFNGNINEESFNGIPDTSCIAVYNAEDENFTILDNAFPTVYYEPSVGLCWNLNGYNTGLPVRGLKGEDGKNSVVYTVNVEYTGNVNDNNAVEVEVNNISEPNETIISGINNNNNLDLEPYNNQAAFVIETDSNNAKRCYFGILTIVEGTENTKVLKVKYHRGAAINVIIENTTITDYLMNINSNTTGAGKGLFLPINKDNKSVHLMTATNITGSDDDVTSGNKNDVLLTPIVNYDDYDSNINVEKYLYLKVDASHAIFDVIITTDDNGVEKIYEGYEHSSSIKEALGKYNYILKYKLSNVIKNENILKSDLVFGNVYADNEKIELTDNNTYYVKADKLNIDISEDSFSLDSNDSIPNEFKSRLDSNDNANNAGIYRWVLDNIHSSFDPIETNDSEYNFGQNEIENYPFNVIYTTTINPGISSSIMWFNGISIASISELTNAEDKTDVEIQNLLNDTNITVNDASISLQDKNLIYGWSICNNNIFNFIKFVPIYINNIKTNEDTALNINYDVNITGDDSTQKRNLTVHGAVSCDDLNVFNLTATGEIKNIYTKDDIIGDNGIYLCKNNDKLSESEENTKESRYDFSVNGSGEIYTKNSLTANDVYVNNSINVKGELESNEISAQKIIIKKDNNNLISILSSSISSNNRSIIKLDKSKSINITRAGTFRPSAPVTPMPIQLNYNIGGNWLDKNNLSSIKVVRNTTENNAATQSKNGDNVNSASVRLPQAYIENPSSIKSDLPAIQHNNAGIILTNTDVDDKRLFYYDQSRYINGIDGGTGVVKNGSNSNYINNNSTEYAKNFNIHGVAAGSNVKTVETTKYGLNIVFDDIEYKYADNRINGGNETFKSNFYYITNNTYNSNFSNNVLTYGIKTTSTIPSSGIFTNDNHPLSGNNPIEYSDLKILQEYHIAAIDSIDTDNQNNSNNIVYFNRNKDITISFNNYFAFNIGIHGKRQKTQGCWPILHSDSYVKLHLYYECVNPDESKSNEIIFKEISNKKYSINYSTNDDTRNSGVEWSGYRYDGEKIGADTKTWRYYTYGFKPQDMVISRDSTAYQEISYAYDRGDIIKLYIIPEVHVYAVSEQSPWGFGDEYCISGVRASNFIPISNKLLEELQSSTGIEFLKNKFKVNLVNDVTIDGLLAEDLISNEFNTIYRLGFIDWRLFHTSGYDTYIDSSKCTYNYYTDNTNSDDIFKSTTICDDGIVFRSGNNVFGIGYVGNIVDYSKASKGDDKHWSDNFIQDTETKQNIGKPVLFYHTYENGMYDNDNNPSIKVDSNDSNKYDGKDLNGYARRTNAIPLDDLFEMINWLKNNKEKIELKD